MRSRRFVALEASALLLLTACQEGEEVNHQDVFVSRLSWEKTCVDVDPEEDPFREYEVLVRTGKKVALPRSLLLHDLYFSRPPAEMPFQEGEFDFFSLESGGEIVCLLAIGKKTKGDSKGEVGLFFHRGSVEHATGVVLASGPGVMLQHEGWRDLLDRMANDKDKDKSE